MAVVNTSFDTNTKEFKLFIDGRELENVEYVSFYNYEDDGDVKTASMNVDIRRKDVDGVNINTSLHASDKGYTSFASSDKTLVDNKGGITIDEEQIMAAINNL